MACKLKQVRRGTSGLSDVLEKLGLGFGNYVKILRTMKNSEDHYFKLSSEKMGSMEVSVRAEVQKQKCPTTM